MALLASGVRPEYPVAEVGSISGPIVLSDQLKLWLYPPQVQNDRRVPLFLNGPTSARLLGWKETMERRHPDPSKSWWSMLQSIGRPLPL